MARRSLVPGFAAGELGVDFGGRRWSWRRRLVGFERGERLCVDHEAAVGHLFERSGLVGKRRQERRETRAWGCALERDREDQPVSRSRRRDIEQAKILGVELSLLVVPFVVEARCREPCFPAGNTQVETMSRAIGHGLDPAVGLRAEVRERDDRILEALRAVHRDKTHRVVARLGDAGVLDVARTSLLGEPAGEGTQAAASARREGARLLDELRQVRGCLLAVPAGERDLDHPEPLDRGANEPGQRRAGAHAVEVEEHVERLAYGIGALGRAVAAVVEPAAARDVEVEILVGAAERRRAQRGDEAHLVVRVVDRRQHRREVAHLLARKERPAALDAIRDPRPAQRFLEELLAGAGGEEDRDVAELARPLRVAVANRPRLRRPRAGSSLRSGTPRCAARPRPSPPARRGRRRRSATRRRARRCQGRAGRSRAARLPPRQARGRTPRSPSR